MNGIYLVDKDKSEINSVKRVFPWLQYGFDVIGSSTDYDKAVREIADLKPVLVIYEWLVGGVGLIRRLKAAGADCELVIATHSWTLGSMRDFFHAGGFDYLRKPLKEQDAEDVLAKLRSRLNDEAKLEAGVV